MYLLKYEKSFCSIVFEHSSLKPIYWTLIHIGKTLTAMAIYVVNWEKNPIKLAPCQWHIKIEL